MEDQKSHGPVKDFGYRFVSLVKFWLSHKLLRDQEHFNLENEHTTFLLRWFWHASSSELERNRPSLIYSFFANLQHRSIAVWAGAKWCNLSL